MIVSAARAPRPIFRYAVRLLTGGGEPLRFPASAVCKYPTNPDFQLSDAVFRRLLLPARSYFTRPTIRILPLRQFSFPEFFSLASGSALSFFVVCPSSTGIPAFSESANFDSTLPTTSSAPAEAAELSCSFIPTEFLPVSPVPSDSVSPPFPAASFSDKDSASRAAATLASTPSSLRPRFSASSEALCSPIAAGL